MSWLNRCQRYFRLRGTLENMRVQVTSFYLLDNTQVWYHSVELNGDPPSWHQFVQLVNTHFIPPLTENPIGELALLQRRGSIEDYCNKFMALSCHDLNISEDHQVQLFTVGLGQQLRTDVALQKPATLDEAVMYARGYAQRDSTGAAPTSAHPTSSVFGWSPSTPANPAPSSGQASSVASINGPMMQTKRLTSAEIAQRRKDGKCFHCDDFFSNGHKTGCKQLFVIEVVSEEEGDMPADIREPIISLHALTCI
jgi:hypothetical protein